MWIAATTYALLGGMYRWFWDQDDDDDDDDEGGAAEVVDTIGERVRRRRRAQSIP